MRVRILFLFGLMAMGIPTSIAAPKGMVLVPAGKFTMGTDEPKVPADQHLARNVHVDAFYIDTHEVTNAEFEEFILADGYNTRKYWTKEGWAFIQKKGSSISTPSGTSTVLINRWGSVKTGCPRHQTSLSSA